MEYKKRMDFFIGCEVAIHELWVEAVVSTRGGDEKERNLSSTQYSGWNLYEEIEEVTKPNKGYTTKGGHLYFGK